MSHNGYMPIDYDKMYETDTKPAIKAPSEPITLPDTDDLKELAESAIPHLVRRAIMLANMSNRLPDVMSVLNSMMDRAKGKPHQAVEHTGKVQFEQLVIMRTPSSLPIIDAEIKELPTKVDEIV